jgi:hypothetical protein
MVPDYTMGSGGVVNLQEHPFALEIVAFPVNIFPGGFPLLGVDALLLASYPGKLADQEGPDYIPGH